MKKRELIRIFSFALAVAVAFGGLFLSERIKREDYRLKIENEYASALYELNASLNNIASVSEKIGLVGTPSRLSVLSSKLYCEAQIAKSALSRLPLNGNGYDRIYLFLSQVGNYAMSVSSELMEKGNLTDEQSNNFLKLSQTANLVANKVDDFQSVNNNPDYWEQQLNGILPESSSLDSTLSETDEQLTDYPSLIYDGPYSEHILDAEPAMLKNADKTDVNSAETFIRKLFGNDMRFAERTNGEYPQYRFENGSITAAISENGGYIVYMRDQRGVQETKIDFGIAEEKAIAFLEKLGIYDMISTYYFTENNMCVINFAYMNEGVVCYTDLIKVGVALDNGDIIMYEASGYLYNHKERYFEKQKYTLKQALGKLNLSLTAVSSALALIPTSGTDERLCYEFLCRRESGEEVLVYINANTLIEEQILILLKTDGGTFVR